MRVLRGELAQEIAPVVDRLAHSDDAPGADRDSRLAYGAQRPQALVVGAGGDDRAVRLAAGIQVVVVGGATRLLEPARLVRREHAERAAGLEPELANAADHVEDAVELGAVLHFSPRRSHA